MGRVGAAGDNAAMESFFALPQRNVLNRKRWASRDELRLANHHLNREDLPPTPPPTPWSSRPDPWSQPNLGQSGTRSRVRCVEAVSG